MDDFADLRSKKNILARDFEAVEKVLRNLSTDGSQHLQVIVDFDRTLSKAYLEDGTVCSGSHAVLAKGGRLPTQITDRITGLYNKYYPVEVDPHKSMEEKLPAMVQWWTEAHDILVNSKLNRNVVTESVARSNIALRDRCNDFFSKLEQFKVPCLIFSAGLGDIIEEVIRQQACFHSNVKVVSNYMDFDKEGVICGFKGELIHVFNKNETALSKSDYFELLSHRDNIILIGDSIGDITMANGTTCCRNILKIGFLNDQNSHRKEAFLDAFDIVIDNDQTMDTPNLILQKIFRQETELGKS